MNDHRPFWKHQQFLKKLGDERSLKAQAERLTHLLKTSVVEYHRDGQILIAIDPAAPIPRVTKGVESAVKHWREGQEPMDMGKARVGQWLDVVAMFEEAELARTEKEILTVILLGSLATRLIPEKALVKILSRGKR